MDMLQLREKEIFETLKKLKRFEFVVIGGYAVNVYVLPRFSVDCDIVVMDNKQLNGIGEELTKTGYIKTKIYNSKLAYHGKFLRYEKTINETFKANIDIMFKEVLDRNTNAKFDAEWVLENSSFRILRGKTIKEDLKLRIVNIDALMVMKLSSCRNTDIRDVFMLVIKAENTKWIKEEINKRYNFENKFNKLKDTIFSKKFRDNLCGVYGFIDEKTFERYKKAILGLDK